MINQEKFYYSLWGQAIKYLMRLIDESNRKDGNKTSNPASLVILIPFLLIICVLLLIAGNEAVKMLFRKNIHKNNVDKINIVICFISFMSVAIGGSMMQFDAFGDGLLNIIAIVINSLFFTTLAILVLFRGIKQWNNKGTKFTKDGESNSFAFWKRYNWSDTKNRYFAEPICMIICGIMFAPINIAGGIVLAFCGVSVWGHALGDWIFNRNSSSSNDFDPPTSGKVISFPG